MADELSPEAAAPEAAAPEAAAPEAATPEAPEAKTEAEAHPLENPLNEPASAAPEAPAPKAPTLPPHQQQFLQRSHKDVMIK